MIKVLGLEQSDEWDGIVRSFTEYDTYWLSGYVKAFFLHGDGIPLMVYCENGDARGINVVMKRSLPPMPDNEEGFHTDEWFDFSTPYGYGGWLIEGETSEGLFTEYEKWCLNNNIISEFVRFHPVIDNQRYSAGSYEVVHLGNTVTIDTSSPEVIWENITSKGRNTIRKAQKNGIKIYNGRSRELYRIFKEIYDGTMDKDHAEEYYYFSDEFYESILEDLSTNAQVFYAEYEGKIIAASIMLAVNGRMNYHLSGSLREYANLAPSNLLLYQASLWGCANGCKTLYLGGGVGSSEDSLYTFKKAFNRQDNDRIFCIGKKIFNKDVYDRLAELHGNTDSSFFPIYRA